MPNQYIPSLGVSYLTQYSNCEPAYFGLLIPNRFILKTLLTRPYFYDNLPKNSVTNLSLMLKFAPFPSFHFYKVALYFCTYQMSNTCLPTNFQPFISLLEVFKHEITCQKLLQLFLSYAKKAWTKALEWNQAEKERKIYC